VLPPNDIEYLKDRGIIYSVSHEVNMTCVVFPNFTVPPGFNQTQAALLLRLNTGYPDVPPDMWWFSPPVWRKDGQSIPGTDVIEQHLGRSWQRWSRHFAAGQWRSGVDGLESFLALLRKELERWVPVVVQ
jgi:hypothetical protein